MYENCTLLHALNTRTFSLTILMRTRCTHAWKSNRTKEPKWPRPRPRPCLSRYQNGSQSRAEIRSLESLLWQCSCHWQNMMLYNQEWVNLCVCGSICRYGGRVMRYTIHIDKLHGCWPLWCWRDQTTQLNQLAPSQMRRQALASNVVLTKNACHITF